MGVGGRKVSNMKNMNKAKRKESHNTPTPWRDHLCTHVRNHITRARMKQPLQLFRSVRPYHYDRANTCRGRPSPLNTIVFELKLE